jgi:hypothetical protein
VTDNPARPLFSPLMAVALVVVGVFAFLAYLVLSAYAPDTDGNDGRATALSRSAIGYAGLGVFLRAQNIPTLVTRGLTPEETERASLLILTPEISNDADEFPEVGPRLIVLPKWVPQLHPDRAGWVSSGRRIDPERLEELLEPLSEGTEVRRRIGAPLARARHDPRGITVPIGRIDDLQTIAGGDWEVLVSDGSGGALLAWRDGDVETYLLSDPDLMNTHGLSNLANARLAFDMIQLMRAGDGPVLFDATLNGFRRSPNVLRLAFEPPLLGVTLCALFASILIGLHAAARFGAPILPERIFAFGKQALADNSAELIAMAGREHRMATRYAQATRDVVARAVGAAHETGGEELNQVLEKLSKRQGTAETLSQMFREAARAEDRDDLLRIARKLYRWRQETIHGR